MWASKAEHVFLSLGRMFPAVGTAVAVKFPMHLQLRTAILHLGGSSVAGIAIGSMGPSYPVRLCLSLSGCSPVPLAAGAGDRRQHGDLQCHHKLGPAGFDPSCCPSRGSSLPLTAGGAMQTGQACGPGRGNKTVSNAGGFTWPERNAKPPK